MNFAQSENLFLDNLVGFSLNLEKYTPKGNFFFLASQFQSSKQQSHHLGFDLRLTNHWAVGGGLKGIFSEKENFWIPHLNLSHSGKILKLDFLKQISIERHNLPQNKFTKLGIGTALAYNYAKFRFVIAGEVGKHYVENTPAVRLFDVSNWRIEAGYYFKKFSLALFFQENGNHYRLLAQYNQQNQIVVPEKDLNIYQNIFGLRLRIFLLNPKCDKKLRILPY